MLVVVQAVLEVVIVSSAGSVWGGLNVSVSGDRSASGGDISVSVRSSGSSVCGGRSGSVCSVSGGSAYYSACGSVSSGRSGSASSVSSGSAYYSACGSVSGGRSGSAELVVLVVVVGLVLMARVLQVVVITELELEACEMVVVCLVWIC